MPEFFVRDTVKLFEGQKVYLDTNIIFATDVDSETESLSFNITRAPATGKIYKKRLYLTINNSFCLTELMNNEINYIHSSSEKFKDSINIFVSDETNKSEIQKLYFLIEPVDDRPIISKPDTLRISEDSTLLLPYNYFENFICDSDTKPADLKIEIEGNENVKVNLSDSCFCFNSKLNWNGITKLVLKVSDKTNVVSENLFLKIIPVNDPPEILYVPEEISFRSDSFAELDLYSMVSDVEDSQQDLEYKFKSDSLNFSFNKENGILKIYSTDKIKGSFALQIQVSDPEGLETNCDLKVNISEYTSIEKSEIPKFFKLYEPYPNPFNPETSLRIDIPERTILKIDLLNILAENCGVIFDNLTEPGSYVFKIDGSNLSGGIYFIRVFTNKFQKVKKVLLIK